MGILDYFKNAKRYNKKIPCGRGITAGEITRGSYVNHNCT